MREIALPGYDVVGIIPVLPGLYSSWYLKALLFSSLSIAF